MNMTTAEKNLSQLGEVQKQCVCALFGSVQNFYDCIYLLTQTEHLLHENKPQDWERKLESAQFCRKLIDKRVQHDCEIDEGLLADIRSDYFEDYANFRERKVALSQNDFIDIIQKLIK